MSGWRLLVVTAVAAERAALEKGGAGLTVVEVGVGMAAAAAATAVALHDVDAVVCAGIGGGFDVALGGLAVATTSIAADLGAQAPDEPGGFLSLDQLGFGSSTVECDPALVQALRQRLPDAVPGPILTVATVTGTASTASALRQRYPGAVAEAMEGFGVASAAARVGVPFTEVRAVSNVVGPRDRTAWRIADALAGLERVGAALATLAR